MIHKLKYRLLCWLLEDQKLLRDLYIHKFISICLRPEQWINLFTTPAELVKCDAKYTFKVEINE